MHWQYRRTVRGTGWLVLAVLTATLFLMQKDRGLALRVPHCVTETTRELLIKVAQARPADLSDPGKGVRLNVAVLDDHRPHCVDLTGRRLRLNWHLPPDIGTGETWRLTAKVRAPWSYRNPGGFDYERWLMANGFNGTGYVRAGERVAEAVPTRRGRARAAVVEQIGDRRNSAHLLALATGDGHSLSDADWSLLRRTGTIHLLVVSGLHVGLVAACGLLLGQGLARLLPFGLLWLPAGRLATGISLAGVGAFVWLAGAGIPAVRAGVMCLFGVLAFAAGRAVPAGRWLALAAVAVILVEPLAPLANGFWLSFGAVCLLIGGFANRSPSYGWLLGLLRAQWIMVLGMTPLVAYVTSETAPVAGIANLYAVPWVSLVVVPLVLLALLTSPWLPIIGDCAWFGADAALSALLGFLQWLNAVDVHRAPIKLWQLLAALVALGFLLCARTWRSALACLPLYALGLVVLDQAPAFGEVRVTSLDVGQGTAVLVDTRRHRLLYDAGARFPSGFDLGEAVVLPAIAATGPARLDRMVISHGDLDHAGGARALLNALPVYSVMTNVADLAGEPCVRGRRWLWDGVEFAILHPPEGYRAEGNDASCVLSVSALGGRVLLPGDIERHAERHLLADGLLAVELLLAPHHGSNTSSSPRFIAALQPALAVATAGLGNPYGHPHPAVVRRYERAGAVVWHTGRDGALTWSSQRPHAIKAHRLHARSLWTWWINEAPHASAGRLKMMD